MPLLEIAIRLPRLVAGVPLSSYGSAPQWIASMASRSARRGVTQRALHDHLLAI